MVKIKDINLPKIAYFQVLTMFRRGLFYSYLSIYLRYFLGLSVTETTFLATFPMIMNIAAQTFIWGQVSDRYQLRRTLIVTGELIAGVLTFFVWYFHTMAATAKGAGYVIIVGLAIVEIFWSMSNLGWTALISDLYPAQARTRIQGKLEGIGALGRIIGVLIGGLAYDGLQNFYPGWGFDRGLLFFITSTVMVVSVIPLFFMTEGGVIIDRKKINGDISRLAGVKISREYLVFLIAMTFINFGRNSVKTIEAQYLVLESGFAVSSTVLSHILNMQFAASFIVGFLLVWIVRRVSDFKLLLFGAACAIVKLVVFAAARTLPALYLANLVAGAADVIILASAYTIASNLIPAEKRGKQFALFNATFFLSWGFAGTLVAGPLADLCLALGFSEAFSYQMSFLSGAFLTAIGVVVLVHFKKLTAKNIELTRETTNSPVT